MPKDMKLHEFGEIKQMAPYSYRATDKPEDRLRENKYAVIDAVKNISDENLKDQGEAIDNFMNFGGMKIRIQNIKQFGEQYEEESVI